MKRPQRALLRKCNKNDSLRFLRFAGVKRRHAFYKSFRSNCDKKKYFMMTMTKMLDSNVTSGLRYRYIEKHTVEYKKPTVLECYNNPSVANCIINKGV